MATVDQQPSATAAPSGAADLERARHRMVQAVLTARLDCENAEPNADPGRYAEAQLRLSAAVRSLEQIDERLHEERLLRLQGASDGVLEFS